MLKTASGFPSDLGVNIPSAKEEMQVQYLHWEDPMEKKNGYPFKYSCLGNPIGRGAWWDTVHRITKSWT